MLHPGFDRGELGMEGAVPEVVDIFQQMTDSVKTLIAAATRGHDPAGVRIAYTAARDQWRAAERESRRTDPGSIERFEGLAALIGGEAYWPAIDAITTGRDPGDELQMARQAAAWIARASEAFLERDHDLAQRYLGLAEKTVGSVRPNPDR